MHDPRLDVVRVFNRQIWAEPFLFVSQYGRLVDINTRSVWDPATGKALEGNMKGASMKQYFGGYSMWFAWYSLNPETFVIPGPGEVPADLLSLNPPGQDTPSASRSASGKAARADPGGAHPTIPPQTPPSNMQPRPAHKTIAMTAHRILTGITMRVVRDRRAASNATHWPRIGRGFSPLWAPNRDPG